MSKNTDIPAIEEIPIKALEIDHALSGRTEKEIKTNAKALAPMLTAFGGWDARQPGEYFERDAKMHLAAGFTRVAACEIAGIKQGFFLKVDDDASKLRTACIRTNAGKPISAYEQGRIYSAMRAGTDPGKAAKGDVILAPMDSKAIAEEVGVSRQWVESCISVFESSPEIGELILDGKVATNVVSKVNALVKEDNKRLRFINAAIKHATANGKDSATMKDMEAVKPDFVQLKAAKKEEPKKDKPEAADDRPATEGDPDEGESSDVAEESAPPPAAQSMMDLGSAKPKEPSKKQIKTLREEYTVVIDVWANERSVVFDDGDMDALLDGLMTVKMPL